MTGQSRRGISRLAVAAVVVTTGWLAAACSSTPAAPSASLGATVDRPVPPAIRQLPLVDQQGRTVSLATFAGKTVLLVPFLSLCTDICPMTTGDLVEVEQAVQADGAGSSVVIVELSVDPGRDSPARLAAYANLTGANWQLVTETPATLVAMAKFFGIYYQTTSEDNPPSIDWWTGQALTYDIDHSDGFIVIGPKGHERFATVAAPNFHGRLNPALQRFLSRAGRQHLVHPAGPNYTPADILSVLSWSMQRDLPARGG